MDHRGLLLRQPLKEDVVELGRVFGVPGSFSGEQIIRGSFETSVIKLGPPLKEEDWVVPCQASHQSVREDEWTAMYEV